MSSRGRNATIQIVGVVLAIGLLFLALRNVDFAGMWDALVSANYWWLIPIVVVTLFSHFLRAWRWRMLLDALPESSGASQDRRVSLKTSFYSVMIGYLLNLVVPRLGEFGRSANLASQTGIKFSSVFGTVVIERIVDFVMLLLILVLVGLALLGSPAADEILFTPLQERFAEFGIQHILILIVAAIGGLAFLFWLPKYLASRHEDGDGLISRIAPILRSFRSGLATLFTSPHRVGIVVTSIVIWIGYGVMLYLPLYMLYMIEPYGLNAMTGLVLLGIGSIGFVLPAPGGIGSYHYFVIQTLVLIYAVPHDVAAGFAVLTHAAQTMLLTIAGSVCLIAQGSTFGGMLKTAQSAEEHSSDEPIFESDNEDG